MRASYFRHFFYLRTWCHGQVDIKDIFGNIRYSTPINEGSKRKYLLMKEDYITLKFLLDDSVHFKLEMV